MSDRVHRGLGARVRGGTRFEAFRAIDADGAAIVIKRATAGLTRERGAALLRHELELLQRLDVPGVARARRLETLEGEPSLLLEEAGIVSLRDHLGGRPMAVEAFLDLAVRMAEVVEQVHRSHVIHRDVSPASVMLDRTGAPTLVDFELATTVPVLAPGAGVPPELEGTLAYVAPEQTGRIDRLVDYRADLYSLGATFHEMLSGAPPFPSADALELVHAHVARVPTALTVLRSDVPIALSDIVLKLLAKMPEQRYQSAGSLRADLEEARTRWRATREIARFELGRHDVPYGLLLAGRLFGRDRERHELQQAFERAARGALELVLVAGPAGIGKSALVDDLHGAIEGRCRWLAGKCDLLRGSVPYAPIVHALRAAVPGLVREPPEVGARLRDAVGPNARLLIETVPDLGRVLCEQPPVPEVGPEEAENRRHRTFAAFLRALAADGPVVLFLDDLQWADPGTLKLLETFAGDAEARSVLLLGAYRSEDVSADHPVARATEAIERGGAPVRRLELASLDRSALVQLLAEALRTDPERVRSLAEITLHKTGGNPFFVRSFLRSAYRDGLLTLDRGAGAWTWDSTRLARSGVSDNVVELLAAAIRGQPPDAQRALSLAACIGNHFELGLLAAISGEPPAKWPPALWAPLREGLIVPTTERPLLAFEPGVAPGPAYRFVHDHVQHAAYQLLDEEAKRGAHLRIGQQLLAQVPEAALDPVICPIADQLERAGERVPEGERIRLAELLERAGRKARSDCAYASALGYFRSGLERLPAAAWEEHHALWFALQRGASECAGLIGDVAQAEQLVDAATPHADPAERVDLCTLAVRALSSHGRFPDAIRRGLEGLASAGVEMPLEGLGAIVDAERARARASLGRRQPSELIDAPLMEGALARARFRLAMSLVAPAWYSNRELTMALVFHAAATAMRDGHTPDAPFAYATYGVLLASEGEYARAIEMARLAHALALRFGNPAEECKVLEVMGALVAPWRVPLAESMPLLRRAHSLGVESGELEFAAYACANFLLMMFTSGAHLDRVLAEADSILRFHRKVAHVGDIPTVEVYRQAVRCLKGLTRSGLDDAEFDEARFFREVASFPIAGEVFHIVRLQVAYLLGDRARAREEAREALRGLSWLHTLFPRVDGHFYAALVAASECAADSADESADALREIRARLEPLAVFRENAPFNWGHKHDLVAAELARIEGRAADALALYHRALESASREGFRQDAALTDELCGRFHLARRETALAAQHLRAAADGFADWGAPAKAALLRAELETTPHLPGSLGVPIAAALDQRSLLEAAEAMTRELALPRLLEKMVRICGAAASAERAALVLDGGALTVRARADALGEVVLEEVPLASSRAVPASVIEHVHREGEILVLRDAAGEGDFRSDPIVAARQVRSVLAVPIRTGSRAHGVLYFENNLASDAFTPQRVETFRLLSAVLAVALENSLLFEARTRAEEALRFLADASAVLVESLDYPATLGRVAHLAVPGLADACVFDLLEEGRIRRVAVAHVVPARETALAAVEDGLSERALRTGEAWIASEVELAWIGAKCATVVPLVARGRNLGAMILASQRADRYDARDLELAEELGSRAGLAVDNARLYEESRASVRVRDEFLDVASHELRTPLNALQLVLQGLLSRTVPATPENVLPAFKIASRQIVRLARLVDELLDVSRIQAGRLALRIEEVDLAEVVRTGVDRFAEDLSRAGCQVSLRVGPAVGRWDRSALDRVVLNLLSNAMKFGAGKPIEVALEHTDRTARLVVTDHGIGISPDRLPHIFERFERAVSARQYGGLGLGLYISRVIVEGLGGSVRAASPGLGAGATFTVELPCVAPPAVLGRWDHAHAT